VVSHLSLTHRAWALADEEHPEATLSFFQELLTEDPSDPVRRFELAGAYDWVGRKTDAIEHYESAIAAGLPGHRDRLARIQLGSILRTVGRSEDAVAVLERVVQDYPHSPTAECFLALALADAGRPRDAVARLVELIARMAVDEDTISYREALQSYARNRDGGVGGDGAVSDLMTLSLPGASTGPAVNDHVELRDIRESDRDALAEAYLAAYPPGVAAGNLSWSTRAVAAGCRLGSVRRDV